VKGKKMKARTLVVSMYLANFLVGAFSALCLLTSLWHHMERWQIAHYVYYMVLALCGVVLSLWLVTDGRYLERCTVKLRDLESRILDFEKRVNNIKMRVRAES